MIPWVDPGLGSGVGQKQAGVLTGRAKKVCQTGKPLSLCESQVGKMRKIHLVPYCVVLTVGNCILPFFLGVVVKLMHEVYDHTIGKEQELPRLTQFALGLPQWFWVFAVVAIIATVGVFVQKVSASLLVHWLLVLCLVEGAALICFTWGVVDPFIMVFWTLGG